MPETATGGPADATTNEPLWPQRRGPTRPTIGFWPWVVILLAGLYLVEPPPPLLGRIASLVTMAVLAWPSWRLFAWINIRFRTAVHRFRSSRRRIDPR